MLSHHVSTRTRSLRTQQTPATVRWHHTPLEFVPSAFPAQELFPPRAEQLLTSKWENVLKTCWHCCYTCCLLCLHRSTTETGCAEELTALRNWQLTGGYQPKGTLPAPRQGHLGERRWVYGLFLLIRLQERTSLKNSKISSQIWSVL